jgi:two-component system, OmpR family, KDP operon response regulator KdpE
MRRGGKTLATKGICSDATDYVKGVIRRLRVKLEPDPAHPKYIITEPHLGYRLRDSL